MAHNYDEEIHKVKKDAVMFFYAPWCGHCKEFDPVFKKVAKKMLKNNENIVFGKMDGSSNDIPYMYPPLKVIMNYFKSQMYSILFYSGISICVLRISIREIRPYFVPGRQDLQVCQGLDQ